MDKKIKTIVVILIVIIVFLVVTLGIVVFGMKNENNSFSVGEQATSQGGVTEINAEVSDAGQMIENNSRVEIIPPDISEWREVSGADDAVVGDDVVYLLPILEAFVIDGRHITEWDVDSLILEHGLYMSNGKYQNEKESENEYEEARIEDFEKSFIWNKVSAKTGNRYAYEFRDTFDDTSGRRYYSFVTLIGNLNGDNPWANEGVAKYATENGILDTKSFLGYLGVSDATANSIIDDGQKYKFPTDCPGDVMIPAVITCDWNGLKISADELTLIYHEDIGRLELVYRDRAFWEWGRIVE